MPPGIGFYDREVVHSLAALLEARYGSVASGICDEPSIILDQVLLLAFAHNLSRSAHAPVCCDETRRPFYDTQSVLREAGLAEYANRLLWHHQGGSGESLLQAYGRESTDRALLRAPLLSVLDHPSRPVYVYRELNTDLAHTGYLDAASSSPGMPSPGSNRPAPPTGRFSSAVALDMLREQREVVCASQHLTLSVCEAPTVPFHCAPATAPPDPAASTSGQQPPASASDKPGDTLDGAAGHGPWQSLRAVVGPARRRGWPPSLGRWVRERMDAAGLSHVADPQDPRAKEIGRRNFNTWGLHMRERCAWGDPHCWAGCYRNCSAAAHTREKPAPWRPW